MPPVMLPPETLRALFDRATAVSPNVGSPSGLIAPPARTLNVDEARIE